MGHVNGQNNVTQSLTETASISQPIRLYGNTNLNFGTIVPGTTTGVVKVTGTIDQVSFGAPPTASTTTMVSFPGGTGPSQYRSGNYTTPQVASFLVTGEPTMTFSIAVSGGASISAGGHSMILQLDPPRGIGIVPSGNCGVFPGTGICAFTIGGSLSVGAHQASGMYTGTFRVLVCYN